MVDPKHLAEWARKERTSLPRLTDVDDDEWILGTAGQQDETEKADSPAARILGDIKAGKISSLGKFFKQAFHLKGATNINVRIDVRNFTRYGETYQQNIIVLDVDLDKRRKCHF